MSIITKDGLHLIQEKDKVFCDSRELATRFGKNHDSVLKKIDKEIKRFETSDLTSQIKDFFIESTYGSRRKQLKRYKLTFEGFQMIALQFTGEKAFHNRLKFIKLFKYLLDNIGKDKLQAMKNSKYGDWLEGIDEGKRVHTILTDTIKEYVAKYRIDVEGKINDGRYYQHYAKLVNAKLGIEVPKGANVRDVVDTRTLFKIEQLEEQIAKRIKELAEEGMHYKDVYQKIKKELKETK